MDEVKRSGLLGRIAWAACLATTMAIGAEARGAGYSGLVVFGDSLSDGGNLAATLGGAFPSDIYPGGKFTNGDVWVDYLAPMLGLQAPTASLLGGTNYAHGYAQTGTGIVYPPELGGFVPVPNLLAQVQSFADSLGGATMDPRELVAVWAGANDILHGAAVDLAGVQAAVGNVMTAVQALYGVGGRQFLVGGLPYLGTIPAASGLSDAEKLGLNQLTFAFNSMLNGALSQFRAAHPEARVAYSDVNATFAAILADSSALGLTNLTDPALAAIPLGGDPNPDHYLFWDTVHPTTAVHRLIAQAAFRAVVPEPSSVVLAAIGGIGAVVAARRRSA